jgi:hypothetical protein
MPFLPRYIPASSALIANIPAASVARTSRKGSGRCSATAHYARLFGPQDIASSQASGHLRRSQHEAYHLISTMTPTASSIAAHLLQHWTRRRQFVACWRKHATVLVPCGGTMPVYNQSGESYLPIVGSRRRVRSLLAFAPNACATGIEIGQPPDRHPPANQHQIDFRQEDRLRHPWPYRLYTEKTSYVVADLQTTLAGVGAAGIT